MQLIEWAKRHSITRQALQELYALYLPPPSPVTTQPTSEAAVQVQIRLEATRQGARLFRNNVGVLYDARGVPVRYGLCNESSAQNKALKSSDLIGLRPLTVTSDMVGRTIGQFMAVEVKHSAWKWSGNSHEEAQIRFLQLVESLGGYGKFVTDPSQL